MLELVDGDEGIGVARNHTFFVSVLALAMAGRHHREVPRIRGL